MMRIFVCIPARNEAKRLPTLLDALAHQSVQNFLILISLNNTTDHSYDVLKAAKLRFEDRLIVDEITFEPHRANAGHARKRVMDLAAARAAPDDILITTDADTRPPLDWVAMNQAAIHGHADIAGGRIVIDESEKISPLIRQIAILNDRYWALVRHIEDSIDPVLCDPPPRHGDHTGASLALRASLYARVGGVPPLATGEDRALVHAAVVAGGRLAHPQSIWTRVSARADGRAAGGMAVAMAEWTRTMPCVPSFDQWRARATWRSSVRANGGAAMVAIEEARLPPMLCDLSLADMVQAA